MKTVTLDVCTPADAMVGFTLAWKADLAVHTDVTALLAAGVLNRAESGEIEFPYEAVKVEFLLQAA